MHLNLAKFDHIKSRGEKLGGIGGQLWLIFAF